jgi:hypothetical protein
MNRSNQNSFTSLSKLCFGRNVLKTYLEGKEIILVRKIDTYKKRKRSVHVYPHVCLHKNEIDDKYIKEEQDELEYFIIKWYSESLIPFLA